MVFSTAVLAESSLNFVTIGFGDRRWCVIRGDCVLADLTVNNLTVLGDITNVTTILSDDWSNVTINESQIIDLQAYIKNDSNANVLTIRAINWTNATITEAQITDLQAYVTNSTVLQVLEINLTEGIVFSNTITNITSNDSCVIIHGATSKLEIC